MKRSAFVLLSSFWLTSVFALQFTAPETLSCRKTVKLLDLEVPTTQLVEQDLKNGIWTHSNEKGNLLSYTFSEQGAAFITESNTSGHVFFQEAFWKVDNMQGSPVLVLSAGKDSNSQLLKVELNCQGITLTDLSSSKEIELTYRPLETEASICQIKANLVGEWTNVTFGAETNPQTFQSLRLKADCTFSMLTMGGIQVQGTWDVSKDGKFLLLSGKMEEQKTSVARIVKVDDHGLMLDQKAPDCERGLNSMTYTFIK